MGWCSDWSGDEAGEEKDDGENTLGIRRASSGTPIPGDGSGGELRDGALLVVAYNRQDYLRKTLDSLATVSSLRDVSVYVSQDGYDVGRVRLSSTPLSTPLYHSPRS